MERREVEEGEELGDVSGVGDNEAAKTRRMVGGWYVEIQGQGDSKHLHPKCLSRQHLLSAVSLSFSIFYQYPPPVET
jgi:hypothetical protein